VRSLTALTNDKYSHRIKNKVLVTIWAQGEVVFKFNNKWLKQMSVIVNVSEKKYSKAVFTEV
jgi:hypothetical protein